MDNIKKICDFLSGGIKEKQRIGLELEHFVCDSDYRVISYDVIASCMSDICKQTSGEEYHEDDELFGIFYNDYSVSLEPGCQIEISITPQENIENMATIYDGFRKVWDKKLAEMGYHFLQCGMHPLVENGDLLPENLPLIPKTRYAIMDRYFENTGKYGKYMMRATASTQVSIDFESEEDAILKLRVFEKLSPILALMTENHSGLGTKDEWEQHILRTQVWNDLDPDRCGYFEGSLQKDFDFEKYAQYIYHKPCILVKKENQIVDGKGATPAEIYTSEELDHVDYLLSMYFPTIRLKQYIEIRVADSLPINQALGFASLIKMIAYDKEILEILDNKLEKITEVHNIYQADQEVAKLGCKAQIYGRSVLYWMNLLFNLAMEKATPEEKKQIQQAMPLSLIQYKYVKLVQGQEKDHMESATKEKEYILSSTAKYHDRAVRSLYIPKIFTSKEVGVFQNLVQDLFGIFEKVIREYEKNESYRKLFGFPKELEELILRPKTYDCDVPIARVDIFYNEQTGNFHFCEFNTDGTSAMNEDRELNCALSLSKAYQEFRSQFKVNTFELFDSWVNEVEKIYAQYYEKHTGNKVPNVAIVDVMENATTNEFIIFQDHFLARGINTEICDIRQLRFDGTNCISPSGMKVDVIYRRAVTSDIMYHLDEVPEFLQAVRANAVCLIGDFRTQIVHNKILYKILYMPETMRLLTKAEQQFVKAHVPMTVSLTTSALQENSELQKSLYEKKDNWIIKPEDSYGSHGVHAGVESNDREWKTFVDECIDGGYILQHFTQPYRLKNIELLEEEPIWVDTSNLTGLFVYNGKLAGIYSRISFDAMISTQYNEMSLPTIIVENES